MSQEDKELLLKDLYSRLSYGVIVQDRNGTHILTPGNTELGTEYIKPYLRPMSSMTEEERKEYHELCDSYYGIYFDTVNSIDWLNAHYFDYRKLIERGLAIEASKGMYNIKE